MKAITIEPESMLAKNITVLYKGKKLEGVYGIIIYPELTIKGLMESTDV